MTLPTETAQPRSIDRATGVRSRRARMRHDLRLRRVMAQTLIANPPWWLETATLGTLLRAIPSVGDVKATAIAREATRLLRARHEGSPSINLDDELGKLVPAARRALVIVVVRFSYTGNP